MTDLMMIVMKAATEAGMKTGMALVEREKLVIGMMTTMVDTGTHVVVMEIVMAEITRNAIAEMVIEMTIIEEEVRVSITSMDQEAGAPTETETMLLMKMVNTHLGMCLYSLMLE